MYMQTWRKKKLFSITRRQFYCKPIVFWGIGPEYRCRSEFKMFNITDKTHFPFIPRMVPWRLQNSPPSRNARAVVARKISPPPLAPPRPHPTWTIRLILTTGRTVWAPQRRLCARIVATRIRIVRRALAPAGRGRMVGRVCFLRKRRFFYNFL